MEELVDILVATYNTEEKYLRKQIDSILKQTHTNIKIYISDDKSTEPNVEKILREYEKMFETLFEYYLDDLKGSKQSSIYDSFLKEMDSSYLKNNTDKRKVIDYIAGMTDDYFVNQYRLISKKHCQKV